MLFDVTQYASEVKKGLFRKRVKTLYLKRFASLYHSRSDLAENALIV